VPWRDELTGPGGVQEALRRFQVVQVDPISVVEHAAPSGRRFVPADSGCAPDASLPGNPAGHMGIVEQTRRASPR